MAVGYRSSSTTAATDAYGSTCAVPVPAGAAAGDIAVVGLVRWEASNPAVTPPTGFTQITQAVNGNEKLALFWKRLTAADSGTYTFSWTGSQYAGGQCVLITGGLATGDPVGSVFNTATATSATIPTTTVTTTDPSFLAHFVSHEDNRTHTPPTNFTEVQDGSYLAANYRIPGASGSQSAAAGTLSSSSLLCTGLVAVAPDAAGPTAQSGTDTATVTDTSALARASTLTDTAALSDAAAGVATTTAVDSATQSDTAQAAASSALVDSATVTDTATSSAAGTATDGAVHADTGAVAAAASAVDTGALVDAGAVAVTVAVSDSAAVTDTALLDAGSGDKADADVAALVEQAAITAATNAVTDTTVHTETTGILAASPVSDGAVLGESVTLLVIISASDAAATSDQPGVNGGLAGTDGAVLTETAAVAALAAAADTAALADLAAVLDLDSLRDVTVTATLAPQGRVTAALAPRRWTAHLEAQP